MSLQLCLIILLDHYSFAQLYVGSKGFFFPLYVLPNSSLAVVDFIFLIIFFIWVLYIKLCMNENLLWISRFL